MSKPAITTQDSITVETSFEEHVTEFCYGELQNFRWRRKWTSSWFALLLHSDKKIVLQATVQGAISWIQAGLPLKKLKIVVFGDQDADLNKCFTSLKEKHVKTHRLQKKNILSYDIFLDYQPSDMSIVKTLSKNLRNRKKGSTIYSNTSKFDEKEEEFRSERMSKPAITTQDSITVETSFGEHVIELCYGDITELPVEEKVDIVMVSAFIGDYSPVHRTLIGALHHNLGISVRLLSREKDMDLRVHYSCWLSKPLPPGLPFGRVLCFEKTRGTDNDSLTRQIRDMFKVLVPVLKNQSTTIITPLLATGCQNSDKKIVLQATVQGAISWIQAGLPLKKLKIVVFGDQDSDLNKCFSSLKEKHLKTDKQKKNILSYDIFLVYQPSDMSIVKTLSKNLSNRKKGLTIYSNASKFNEKEVWQQGIFDLMMGSKRIVPVLTCSFVQSGECLEMFNMAICCTRRRGKDFLVPLYFETIQIIPVSISLVQFLDCRVRKEGETAEEKMEMACIRLMLTEPEEEEKVTSEGENQFSHDVFISYAHKNPNEAHLLLVEFEKQFPDLDVFFDRQDLQVGGLWQKSLYYSLDSVKCVIALVSRSYLSSVICQEEFNIALYRCHRTPEDFLLILVCIEDLPSVPCCYGEHKLIDGRGNQYNELVPNLVKDVAHWVLEKKRPTYLANTSTEVSQYFDFAKQSEIRKKAIYDNYNMKINSIERKVPFDMKPLDQSLCHVVVSVSQNDLSLATSFLHQLQKISPDINTVLISDNTGIDLKCLQTAQKIVVFISKQYLESAHHLEELFIAIIRQRSEKERKVLYVCQSMEVEKPAFANLLPVDVCLRDEYWEKMFNESSKTVKLDIMELKGSFSYKSQDFAAMTKLADEILLELAGHTQSKPSPIIANAGKGNSNELVELEKCLLKTGLSSKKFGADSTDAVSRSPAKGSSLSKERTENVPKLEPPTSEDNHPNQSVSNSRSKSAPTNTGNKSSSCNIL
ncbi:uncharacterized protein LOC133178163 [Saccostrea echinata]|uniref:uncharacterized protein LOC133178163 n=1 Tax=Saccostrea echinata TaxID=191078 RepID=UPI002A80A32C|nr:uncharacterized protein LOC133178163 [Saccostrea echinata]